MAAVLHCPRCQARLILDDDRTEERFQCPKCGVTIKVRFSRSPSPSPPPTAPPSEPVVPEVPLSDPTTRSIICPSCSRPAVLPQPWPHPAFLCPHCYATVVLSAPSPSPEPAPVPPFTMDNQPSAPASSFTLEDELSISRIRQRMARRRTTAPTNQALAGIGAAILLIGLFLPMVSAAGSWLSFIDVTWKAATLGRILVETDDGARPPQGRGLQLQDESNRKLSHTEIALVVVGIFAILYPIYTFVLVAITFFQICVGTRRGVYALLGGLALFATIFYGIALYALSTHKEFAFFAVLASPGFGWAVVLVGAVVLTIAGMIEAQPPIRGIP